MSTEQEIQVLTDEAQQAIAEADKWYEESMALQEEVNFLKGRINAVLHAIDNCDEHSVPCSLLLDILKETY